MKTFKQISEAVKAKNMSGDLVFSKNTNKVNVTVLRVKNKFVVYIDKDELDTFSSQKEAEKAGVQFAKELKGMR